MTLLEMRRAMMLNTVGDEDNAKKYLTIEMLEAGTITFKIATNLDVANCASISYSVDNGSTWTTTPNTASTLVTITTPSLAAGTKVLWKGLSAKLSTGTASNELPDDTKNSRFVLDTTSCNLYGNIMSMYYGDDFIGKTSGGVYNGSETTSTYNHRMCFLFYQAKGLIDASGLVIPFTSLGEQMAYGMFRGCSALTAAPSLPATTLSKFCYTSMFRDCSSLTTAPELPAIELAQYSYHCMFQSCSSLNYVKAMFTTTPSNSYTYYWLQNVSSSGTFIKNSEAEWTTTGANGVPANWTVETADS